jgi:hypothetical protein
MGVYSIIIADLLLIIPDFCIFFSKLDLALLKKDLHEIEIRRRNRRIPNNHINLWSG